MEGMRGSLNRILTLLVGLSLAATPALAQKRKGPKVVKAPEQSAATQQQPSAEPDKILYDRALVDIKHGRYTEGRLSLETLINTYPDSEYLAKAKLAVADSYFKEGGTSNLTQAISEYQDFITFFPFLEEAAYAQMQVAMAHYRMMEKADRDDEQALEAEDSFQSFILKYPQSSLVPQAEQHLREVQEVLAQGEYEIARYYYTKPDYRAAAARLVELTQRYPLFSQSDQALFMLGDIYQKARIAVKNEDEKNHWSDLAAECYDRILTDYPLSKRSDDAKRRLQEMNMPVPSADPAAYARMAREQKLEDASHHQVSLFKMPLAFFDSKPNVSDAAHIGAPNLNPPNDAISATDVLRPDAPGPQFNLGSQSPAAPSAGAAAYGGSQVDVSQGGSSASVGATVGAQIISTGGQASSPAPSAPSPAASGNDPNIQMITPQAVTGSDAGASAPQQPPTPNDVTPSAQGSNIPVSPSSQPTTGAAPAPDASATASSGSDSSSSSGESSSKKKKGFRKLIPW